MGVARRRPLEQESSFALALMLEADRRATLPTAHDELFAIAPPAQAQSILAQAADPPRPFAPDHGYRADWIGGYVYRLEDVREFITGPGAIGKLVEGLVLDDPPSGYTDESSSIYAVVGRTVRTRVWLPSRRIYDVYNSRPENTPKPVPPGRCLPRASASSRYDGRSAVHAAGRLCPEFVVVGDGQLALRAQLWRIDDTVVTPVAELRPDRDGELAWHATVPVPTPAPSPAVPAQHSPLPLLPGEPIPAPTQPAPTQPAPAPAPAVEDPMAMALAEAMAFAHGTDNPAGITAMMEWQTRATEWAREMRDAATAVAGNDWASTVEYFYRAPDGSAAQIGFIYAADGRSGNLLGPRHDRLRAAIRAGAAQHQRNNPWRIMTLTVTRDSGDVDFRYLFDAGEVDPLQQLYYEPTGTMLRERLRPGPANGGRR